jgi:hypothetical protein
MPANDGLHAWSAGRLLGLMECPAGSSSVLGHRKPDPVDQLVSQFLRLFHGCRRLPQRTRIRSEADDAEHHPGDSCDNERFEIDRPGDYRCCPDCAGKNCRLRDENDLSAVLHDFRVVLDLIFQTHDLVAQIAIRNIDTGSHSASTLLPPRVPGPVGRSS